MDDGSYETPGQIQSAGATSFVPTDFVQSATGGPIRALAVTQRRAQGPTAPAQPTKLLPGGLVPTAPAPSANGRRTPSART
jgi:hypothetical protein